MKTFAIQTSSEKEIKLAIQKQWNLNDRIRVNSLEVSGQRLVGIMQDMGLDTKFVTCVVCNGYPELWHSKREAMKYYEFCWRSCEGSEATRYNNIWYKLSRGYKVATDIA